MKYNYTLFRDLKLEVEVDIFGMCVFGINIEPEALLKKITKL